VRLARLIGWRARSPRAREEVAALALSLLALLAALIPKAPGGRARGRAARSGARALDFAIPFLEGAIRRPRRLVIATNYESYP
jgi:hypothetical protein